MGEKGIVWVFHQIHRIHLTKGFSRLRKAKKCHSVNNLSLVRTSYSKLHYRDVKTNNRVFIIPLLLLENIRYSIIPVKKNLLFCWKNLLFPVDKSIIPKEVVIPLFRPTQFPLCLCHYSSSTPDTFEIYLVWLNEPNYLNLSVATDRTSPKFQWRF